jgi:hypothetical protein
MFVPDSNAPNGQGFSQALYLKGHWFPSGAAAREGYLTLKPLLEASGNGRYVEQTGVAGFGIQRTVWGASFPSPDNPNVTIQRVIALIRWRHVVIEATLDPYCLAAAATGPALGAAKTAGQPLGDICADGAVPYFQETLGPLLVDSLGAAETDHMLTRYVPVDEDTSDVQIDLARLRGQDIGSFRQLTPQQQARRDEFNLDADTRISFQYAGVDRDGKPQYVLGNTWFYEQVHEGEIFRMDDLVEIVADGDEQIGAKREDIPSFALSGEGWAITANAFVFPQADGTNVGGVEFRATKNTDEHTEMATLAVVSTQPPEATPQGVADEFERRAAEAVCDPSTPPDAAPDVDAQIMFVALFLNLDYLTLGSALAGGGFVNVLGEEELRRLGIEEAPDGEEPPPPVGSFLGIGSDVPAENPPATLC